MTKTMMTLIMTTCLALTGAATASAQVQPAPVARGFVSVNVGAQPARGSISTGASFRVYDEGGTFSAEGGVANGSFFEVSGGVKVWRNLSVGIGYTGFSSKSNSSVTSSVPHPLFFNRPSTATQVVADLQRTEHGVHVMALWLVPVTSKIDVSLSVGPSFIQIEQQFVSSGTVGTGTQTFTPALATESGRVNGANVGFDGTYMFSSRFGAGLLIRWAGGKSDLASVKGVSAGGFQTGIGARLRF